MSSNTQTNLEKGTENVETSVNNATTDLQDGIKNTSDDVAESVRGVFTTTNMLILIGFLGVYFGYSYYSRLKNGGVETGDSFNRNTSMVVDILFFIIFAIIIYVIFTSDTLNSKTITSRFIDGLTDYIDNPSSVIISVLVLVGLYLVVYLFGIPTDKETKPLSISIIETIAWVLLIISVFVDFFKYVFGISFDEFFDKIKKFFTGEEDEEEDTEQTTMIPVIDQNEVFNVSNNLYTYDDAKAVCKAMDAELATYDQVEEAYNNGAEWCNYGWSDGQMALFPTQKSTWNKLQKLDEKCTSESEKRGNNCGRPGVNGGYIANPYVKFGVNCYGKKPKATADDIRYMKAKENQPYPKTRAERELEEKVNHWKENKNKFLQLNSYNTKEWNSKNTISTGSTTLNTTTKEDCD